MTKPKKQARPLRAKRKPRKAERDMIAAKTQQLHVKTGDIVQVISGKDGPKKVDGEWKVTEGKVLKVLKKTSRAVVEGVNMIKKHQKPNNQFQKGQVVEREAPIHVSNLKVVEDA